MPTDAAGVYVLVATVTVNPSFNAGWNGFGYPLFGSQGVTTALSSIEGQYSILASPSVDGSGDWLVYDPTVLPPFDALVNTLDQLEFARPYWVHVLTPTTLYLNPTASQEMVRQPTFLADEQPPGVFYGWITATTGLQPKEGDTLTAWVDGTLCGETTLEMVNGRLAYSLHVAAASKESHTCGSPDKTIILRLGDARLVDELVWTNREAQFQSLDSDAGATSSLSIYLPVIQH